MIPSLSYDQDDIIAAILALHCTDGFDVDVTYGNGAFYKKAPVPRWCFDIDPQKPNVLPFSSTELPLPDDFARSVVFDPPFLTYVQNGRAHGSVMTARFGGYYTYDELRQHYIDTLRECRRVLKHKGILVFKCQDIIHNHRMHCTHANVIAWATEHGYRLRDLFVLGAKHRMPGPQRGTQRHARIFHSYFLVLECRK